MRKSRFTAEQAAHAVGQVEAVVPLEEVCRKMGVSAQTFYRWRKKLAGLAPSEAKRRKQLEGESRRLKRHRGGAGAGQADVPGRRAKERLSPARRRELALEQPESYRISERRACQETGFPRGSLR